MADQLRYIEADRIRAVERPGSVGLRIELVDEQTILNAQVRRVFPLSYPDELISIRDGAGKEVAVLKSVEGLEPGTRRLFDRELDRRYFTPAIEQIETLK
ncbi:MAG TPA: DUF1854 domain-containing protein, partial [Fimbriimonas sp.]